MKFLPLLFLPLLGCETFPYPELSYDELYQQASDCKAAKAVGCDPLWAEVQRRDDRRDAREAKIEAEACHQDLVSYKDRGRYYCITRDQARRILNSMGGRRY